jgi:hypothetical protein
MSAPRASRAQLRPVVEGALSSSASGHKSDLVLVHADPSSTPALGAIGGHEVTVVGSSSPLQIRRALRDRPNGPLVVLTDLEQSQLGDDLLARAAGRKVHRLDRWASVCRLFGAERPSAALAKRKHLADALIDAQPLAGYPRVTSRVLDLDTATAALVRTSLGISDDVDDLAGFVEWASRAEAAGRLANSQGHVIDDLLPTLTDRFGAGVDGVILAVMAGHTDQLVPLGIVAGLVHDAGPEGTVPATRLDERLGRAKLDDTALRAWGEASAELIRRVDDRAKEAGWLERAETLVADLGATALAHRSDLLRTAFEQRIAQAATALVRWQTSPDDPNLADEAHAAIRSVERHRASGRTPERLQRLQMVARLIRRRGFDLVKATDLGSVASNYQRDGAWLDAARVVVSRGDRDATLAILCTQLTDQADAARQEQGHALASVLAEAAHRLPASAGVVGVEDVLSRVVAPLGEQRPVLVIVLDGLGLPTYCDVIDHIESAGWVLWHPPSTDDGLVGVAALPTVTEKSRTSLLCGELRGGDDGSEARGFAKHAALRQISHPDAPPMLFHKRHLRAGGLDTPPGDVLDAVADTRRRAVGLVINNIDERLKDVAQPVAGWGMGELDPLGQVLAAARQSGRAVVLTADHGHILDRGAEHRPGAVGGERWRPGESAAGDGEIAVHGPRVVVDGQRAVLPWREQLHYGTRRNGYHGGLTPQEVFVPVSVLTAEDLEGWTPTTTRKPLWWHHTAVLPSQGTPMPAAVAPPEPAKPAAAAAPTLFDAVPDADTGVVHETGSTDVAEASTTAAGSFTERVLASAQLTERRRNPRIRLDEYQVRNLLLVLETVGTTTVTDRRLAEEAGLPPARIGRYVAQLQDLLNVDGYAVVTTSDGEVRFDAALLERQLDL